MIPFEVDKEKCNRDGLCVEECPARIIRLDAKQDIPVPEADFASYCIEYESLGALGTMLGSAGIMVIEAGTCMVWALAVVTRFYAHESCGQCTPCREGTAWVNDILWRLERGGATPEDIGLVHNLCDNMMGTTICVLADACVMPVQSFLKKFKSEFDAHIEHGRCPLPQPVLD